MYYIKPDLHNVKGSGKVIVDQHQNVITSIGLSLAYAYHVLSCDRFFTIVYALLDD